MKNYTKLIYIAIGGVLFTSLICFAIFQYYEYLSNNITFRPYISPTFVPPKVTEQPKVKTYTNSDAGYTFDYPGQYKLLGEMELQPNNTYDFSQQINSLNEGMSSYAITINISTVLSNKLPIKKTCSEDDNFGEVCNTTLADLQREKIEQDKIKVGDALPNMGIAVSKDTKGGVIDLYYSTQVGNWYLYYSLYDKNYNHIMVNISLASERNREKIPFDAEEIIALKKISDTLKFIK